MVDSLIREQMDALELASDDARIKLREWELPECLQALDAGSAAALPDGLRSELERLEDHGGVRHLQDLQKQVQVIFKEIFGRLSTWMADQSFRQTRRSLHSQLVCALPASLSLLFATAYEWPKARCWQTYSC